LYDFTTKIDRKNTNSIKWDFCDTILKGKKLFPMWVADMDFAVAPEIQNAIQERLNHPVYGYTAKSSNADDAFIKWCKLQYNWNINSNHILFSPGVVPALSMAVFAFTNPGDGIIIQPPIYPPFFDVVQKTGRTLISNPLLYTEGKYSIDFNHLENCMKKGARMLLFCSPHNPVGRVWKYDELETLAKLADRYKVLVISDEIHADIIFSKYRHIPFASVSETAAQTSITALAPSKTFNIPGLQASALVIANNKIRNTFSHIQHGMHLFIPNTFGITAFQAAYEFGSPWLHELLTYLEGNRDYLYSQLKKELPGVACPEIEGTFLAWLDFNSIVTDHKELEKRIYETAQLGLNNGISFGHKEGTGFMRLNFGTQRSRLEEGISRLKKILPAQ